MSSALRPRPAWVILLLGAFPFAARANVDDPGPASPPPATTRAAPPATAATAAPAPTAAPPAAATTAAPAASSRPDDWEPRLVAPTISGPVGLFRTLTAEVGVPLNFRIGLHLEGFRLRNFLVGRTDPTGGDVNSRILGALTLSLTLPDQTFVRHLELYLGIYNASNENVRRDPGRSDPQVILSLGDVGFGVKGAWKLHRGLSLGGHVGVRFFNAVNGVLANFAATNVSVDALASLDLRAYAPRVPLRLHFNGGILVDNSLRLLPEGQCSESLRIDACIRSRVVEIFAYGLGTTRLRYAFAIEAPLRFRAPTGPVGFAPFLEYHVDRSVADGDRTVATVLTREGYSDRQVNNPVIQYFTAGVRLRPVAGLVLDAGLDIGLTSPGFRLGSPIPAYNIILGAAYAYDPVRKCPPPAAPAPPPPPPPPKEPPRPAEGRIRGVVRDAVTHQPIAGAVVRYVERELTPQLTVDDGSFVSYPLPVGEVRLEVSHPDYERLPSTAQVARDEVTPLDILLTPRPKESKVFVRAVDDKGAPVPGVLARAQGPTNREGKPSQDGQLMTLPAGEYTLVVEAPGYLAKERRITVVDERDQLVEVTLRARPVETHVVVTREAIVIKGTIHFVVNEATILPDGQQLLDEVVDVLAKNPQIRKVSIEGHTDNRGSPARNLKLSRQRAEAVRNYLVAQGIAAGRLTSQGFGPSRPLVPNLTPANRARNRRVEFRILEQD